MNYYAEWMKARSYPLEGYAGTDHSSGAILCEGPDGAWTDLVGVMTGTLIGNKIYYLGTTWEGDGDIKFTMITYTLN